MNDNFLRDLKLNISRFFLGTVAILLSLLIFFACNTSSSGSIDMSDGAIDTEPPTGSISSPVVNAIIRDAFAIQGYWKDDGAVGQITVSLRNTITNATNTYNASVSPDGTWLCAVNPFDSAQPLVDGTYLATVTIYDNGGYTFTSTRSYTIDNTPPVVIISKPKSSVTTSDPIEVYGRNITLSGLAADANYIFKIEMIFYSDEACATMPLATTTALNVPPTFDLNIPTFEETLYSKIYTSTGKNGSVPRYCKIYAYDGAQRYPADGSLQTDSDRIGNVQSFFYLYSNIKKAGLDVYRITELYSIFAGDYTINSDSIITHDKISDVISKLNEIKDSVAKFNLNPDYDDQ